MPVTEALASNPGALLPFMPTLATALAVAALALLCRPATPPQTQTAAAVEAARVGADGFHPVPAPTPGMTAAVPSTLAFGRLHLPAFAEDAPKHAAAPAARPAHVAAQSAAQSAHGPAAAAATASRRTCTAPATAGARCGETRRSDTARGPSVPSPVPGQVRPASDAVAAPRRILPFLPAEPEPEEDDLPTGALPYASTAAAWMGDLRKLGGRIGSGVGEGAASVGGTVVELLASAR